MRTVIVSAAVAISVDTDSDEAATRLVREVFAAESVRALRDYPAINPATGRRVEAAVCVPAYDGRIEIVGVISGFVGLGDHAIREAQEEG